MAITMKTCSFVKPAIQILNDPICLSDCDQDKPRLHVPLIYFYRPSNSLFSLSTASQTLKDALSQVLVHFYPLAGRLHMNDVTDRFVLECNSAGVMFYEAESDARIEDFKDFAPTEDLRSLIPSVDPSIELHQKSLLLVQLTRFSCGGFSLGVAVSHILVDATSFSHFMSEWARIARGESLLNSPFLDRSILLGSRSANNYTLPKPNRYDPLPLLMGNHNDHEERNKETILVTLHLSVANILKLKEVANEGLVGSNVRGYSRYEVVAGHMWRCANIARNHNPDQPTKLAITVSFRNRMPSLPKEYFGNAYYKTFASTTSGKLTTMPLAYAARTIREAIEIVTEEYVKLNLDLTASQTDLNHVPGTNQGSFVGNPNMAITSWMGIPYSGNDFGWGEEVYMGPGNINSEGKCFILPGRIEAGSLTIPLRLQTSYIDNFLEYFYKGI